MSQKSQKGFSLMELLIVIAIIMIIIVIGSPIFSNSANFKDSFGVAIGLGQPSDEERAIIQPLVTKRLRELREDLHAAQNTLPENINVNEVARRVTEAKKIKTKLNDAESSAKYFGFNIDTK